MYLYLQCCSKILSCIFQTLSSLPLQAMLFLPLLLLAAPSFRVIAYPNAEYLDLHHKQVSSHKLLKPRDSQDSSLPFDVAALDLSTPEQSSSSTNQGLNTGWDSPDQGPSTDYTNQDETQNLASPDLQAQACAAGPTRTNGKVRRGLSCAVRTAPQAPPKAPEGKPNTREDITPPKPSAPPKPLPLVINKDTGQVELDLGPEFAPTPQYESNGPCSSRKLVCCTGELPFPSGNIENCWRCMSSEARKERESRDVLTPCKVNRMISFCLDQEFYYCCTYLNVSELDFFFFLKLLSWRTVKLISI